MTIECHKYNTTQSDTTCHQESIASYIEHFLTFIHIKRLLQKPWAHTGFVLQNAIVEEIKSLDGSDTDRKKKFTWEWIKGIQENEKCKKQMKLLGHKRKPSNFLFKIANKEKVWQHFSHSYPSRGLKRYAMII